MTYKRLAAIGILTLLLLSGCGRIGRGAPKVCKDNLTPVKQTGYVFPKASSIGIYIDTTPSMEGFLCIQREASSPNYYTLCLNELRNMTAADYKEEDTHFYRVDTSVWETPENALTEAKNSEYYVASESLKESRGYENISDGDGYSYPCLTAALENGQKEDFFILITDLYENNSDNAATLINAFQKLAGMDDKKIWGLFAVRTQFAGKVYDVGPDNLTIEYGLDQDAFRPFYVIVRSYPDAVNDFFDRLEERLHIPDGGYAREVFYAPSFQGLDYQNFNNCFIDETLIWEQGNTTVLINGEDELPVYDYLGDRNTLSEEMMFSYLVPDSLREEFEDFAKKFGNRETISIRSASEQVYRLGIPASEMQISRWSDGDQEFQSAKGAYGNFTVSSLLYNADQGMLYAGVKISGLAQGIWRLQWRNVVNQENEASDWWKEWGSYGGSDDCSKTERLGDYVNAVKGALSQEEMCILNGSIYLSVKG